MASNTFNVPSSGTGSGAINISTKAINSGTTVKSSTMTVTNRDVSTSATLRQAYRPRVARSGSGNIPGSGGTMTVNVNSPYGFYFRNNPSNISSIKVGNTDYKAVNPISSGSYAFEVTISQNSTLSARTDTLEVAFQKYNGTYSFNNPDSSLFKFNYTQESGGTEPVVVQSIALSANSPIGSGDTLLNYSVSADPAGTVFLLSGNTLLGSQGVSGETSGYFVVGANPTTSARTFTLSGVTLDGLHSDVKQVIQNAAAESGETSGQTVNIPVYFEYDGGDYVYIALGSAVPFTVNTTIELTYRNGNQELCPNNIPANTKRVVFSEFGGSPVDLSIFDTSDLNYAKITNLDLGNGAPEIQVTYNDTDYYLWWSEADSQNFADYLATLGNDLSGVTWGTPPETPVPYDGQYFTIEALSAGTLSWNMSGLTYSKNDGAWTTWNSGSTLSVSQGDKVRFKSNSNTQYATPYGDYYNVHNTGKYNATGNIMSLLYGDNFSGQTTLSTIWTFGRLFKGETNLISAENLILPAMTLANNCYYDLFDGCTGLIAAPALPATTLADRCYCGMFYGCSSLATAPALPATTLVSSCYDNMFQGCTSLTTAPALPATTLAESCYSYMFNGCTGLIAAPALPATTLSTRCYSCMFQGCTSLTTAPALPATTLAGSCYAAMFYNCSSLVNAPVLSATTLADRCYQDMFFKCTSLATAPELPATTLAGSCYQNMFQGCTSLTTAPVLPATNLRSFCYYYMFQGCTSLNYVKCLATNISAASSHTNWLLGVSSTGTFVKPASMTSWAIGTSGIPNNWLIQDA